MTVGLPPGRWHGLPRHIDHTGLGGQLEGHWIAWTSLEAVVLHMLTDYELEAKFRKVAEKSEEFLI